MDTSVKITATVVISIAIVVAGYFAFKAIKKSMDEKKFNNQDIISQPRTNADIEKNRKSMANMYANQLRSAFNPSGNGWMIAMDTTDTDTVMQISANMKQNSVPFSYVSSAYQTAYKDNLATRLQSELSATELAKFYATAGMQGIGSLGAVTDALILA